MTTPTLGQLLKQRLWAAGAQTGKTIQADWRAGEKTPTVRADGESFVQRCLVDAWHRAQDPDILIQWLRDNHTSPWSHGGPLAATLSSYDTASAERLLGEVRDYYTLRWSHQKMTQGGQTSEWRRTIIRCLNGQVHQDQDEGAVSSLYWLYLADTTRDRLACYEGTVPAGQTHHDLQLRALERSVRFGRRLGAHKWMVDYWWLDQEQRLILWPVRQNDQGLGFLDHFWKKSLRHQTVLSVQARCQPLRDWVLGTVNTVSGVEIRDTP